MTNVMVLALWITRLLLTSWISAFDPQSSRSGGRSMNLAVHGTNPQENLPSPGGEEVRSRRLSLEVTCFVPQPGPGGSPVRTQPHMAPRMRLELVPDAASA